MIQGDIAESEATASKVNTTNEDADFLKTHRVIYSGAKRQCGASKLIQRVLTVNMAPGMRYGRRLWSPKDLRDVEEASLRLIKHRCRLVKNTGVQAGPIWAGYCDSAYK